MIIVSDTTPLRYLIEIEVVEILATFFGQVIIPQAVALELQHQNTPPKIKNWMQTPPQWLDIRQADLSLFSPAKPLGPGETEAIALALELQDAAILMDETAGKVEALRFGLKVIPTLAILETAAARSLLDLPLVIARLKQTSFRAAPQLYQEMLRRDAQRKLNNDQIQDQ